MHKKDNIIFLLSLSWNVHVFCRLRVLVCVFTRMNDLL